MDILEKKVEKIISEIAMVVKPTVQTLFPVKIKECGYKTDNTLPAVDDSWREYFAGERYGGVDKHFWIYKRFKTPDCDEKHELRLTINTGSANHYSRSSRNPQCILYANGELVQGLDLNHLEYALKPNADYEIYIYLYTGMFDSYYDMSIGIVSVNKIYEELYYDIKVPFDSAALFDEKDFMHIETIKHLNIAVMKLDMRNGASTEFEKSAVEAIKYLLPFRKSVPRAY